MDLNNHCLCPTCKEPMDLLLPIWVTPGEEHIDTGNVVWDSSNHKDSDNWWCANCESHHFPLEVQRHDVNSGNRKSLN